MQICISGIHTDTGKTHTSAMLCSILKYKYFKVIQAGLPKDSDKIKTFDSDIQTYPEGFFLKTPASPHIAKKLEQAVYKGLSIQIPLESNLIIETAGGLFSPLDETSFMIDFILKNKLPTFLVGKYYLGAINHIFLSLEALKSRNIKILGLIINGEKNPEIDDLIYQHTKIKPIHLPFFNQKNFLSIKEDFKTELETILNLNAL
ncbi:dethiobiotin synthase [Helicobacter anatolicus]|uniref:dethiobiotin synthase n=1 Tax=Helicobacter anatolicus TaxID=2905874 RepID=UPI001E40AB1D|nr:dethiobiotin synthase [Helicobacter anatolicus]MCE3038002.1 dethiobiotin synthase [Helicobacter anatolicus]MCE3040521.1 dethiobiotin synthase [Helicobacter anatolicus]